MTLPVLYTVTGMLTDPAARAVQPGYTHCIMHCAMTVSSSICSHGTHDNARPVRADSAPAAGAPGRARAGLRQTRPRAGRGAAESGAAARAGVRFGRARHI
jgi:hypothetical protein